ncbi:YciI family protein [Streptomyces sp. NK08204]|uniref:YciI family protein n=1 Tax=Streptomyces sp. NK08204 TaxID=2873260 RepID=UPI001CEC8DCD|nr:YciI family protein [Streptomyces sp. NK08204]
MRYLVMVQATQADYDAMAGRPTPHSPSWTEVQLKAMYAYMSVINDELTETGELIDAEGLAEPARTRLVARGKDGGTLITDSPYCETKEVMAGYWVLDCASLERVTEIAERVTRCPGPEGLADYPVVIRPIMDGPDGIGA